ncbi:MAG TPA: hypothetical protein VGR31_00060 [Planctomycetota bacterium]|jgi:tetratricopeptide (TPR) repeat protein|nr:hypothetical protein [Planctomycetota bacterium]
MKSILRSARVASPRWTGVLALALVCTAAARAQKVVDRDRQILWQRTVEDAVHLAKAEKRPLLVAVNMDGESASERIVRERYRDPAFVARTRPFVCVIASAFRHAPRDHDDQGRRIPCPRLGEVTCGEHIALEPILFDRYLGGERIAPRHAVILPDGTKDFDVFMLFDMRDLDKKLAEADKLAPPPSAVSARPTLSGPPSQPASWAALARAKDHLGRAAFEEALFGLVSEADGAAALRAISSAGDAGSVEALRVLLQRSPPPSPELLETLAKTVEALGIQAPAAAALREQIAGLGRRPGAPGLDEDANLLPLLRRVDAASAASRTLLFAYAALGAEPDSARAAPALGAELKVPKPRPDIARWWSGLRDAPPVDPAPPKPVAELRSPASLEEELSELDRELDTRPNDPELTARYGRASLALAERRTENGSEGAPLLLQDADRFLERSWQGGKRDVTLLFERAKIAYLRGKYADEEKLAIEAETAAPPDARIEAERWIGDAAARLLAARSGADAAAELDGIVRGARAFTEVAASASADDTDWISLGSFLGALGMRREEVAILGLAAERRVASPAIRGALNAALWAGGRIELAAPKAEWIAARNPDSADAAWHAGFARMLLGEDLRRGEDPDGAIRAYEKASAWFRRCAELRPEYKENTDHYRALCGLGSGFAHLLADRRADAARCFAEAVAIRPAIEGTRDGLDREPVDLLDGALEWRESGRSPVDVAGLVGALERLAPADSTWIRAVADSELREALRADGRGEIVEGDRYLRVSIDAARRAVAVSDDEENRRALAQSLTILAERLLERGDAGEARRWLAEAAPLLGETAPSANDDTEALKGLAAKLRTALGEARPRFRPGR